MRKAKIKDLTAAAVKRTNTGFEIQQDTTRAVPDSSNSCRP